MHAGPRATSAFLVVTALLFAALLVLVAWQSRTAGSAAWLLAAGFVVAVVAAILGIFLAQGVREGKL